MVQSVMDYFSWLSASPSWYLSYALVTGLMVGSFLNVVAHRLPLMMHRDWDRDCREFLKLPLVDEDEPYNLAVPRSRCPQCGHAIRAWENIPVLSYLFLRGKCSSCGGRISPRYPLVELLTGLLSLTIVWRFGFTLEALAALLFAWTLIALTLIDLDEQLLPDSLVYPLLWGGLFLSLLGAESPVDWPGFRDSMQGIYQGPATALYGAIAAYLMFWIPSRILGVLLRKETFGQGDLKLLAALGVWVGWPGIFQVVTIAVFTALGAFALSYILPGSDHRARLPFGPFLALGALETLLFGVHLQLAH